jgi:hypothetical protein
MQASHAILDQVQHDVVLAIYPGPRGELTVLVAADVKDELTVRKAMHDILATANTAVTTFNTLGGDKKDSSFSVSLKANGIKVGGVEGELFSLGMPKNMATDLEGARPLLTDKQQIEIAAVTAGGSAVLTLGHDARARHRRGRRPQAGRAQDQPGERRRPRAGPHSQPGVPLLHQHQPRLAGPRRPVRRRDDAHRQEAPQGPRRCRGGGHPRRRRPRGRRPPRPQAGGAGGRVSARACWCSRPPTPPRSASCGRASPRRLPPEDKPLGGGSKGLLR